MSLEQAKEVLRKEAEAILNLEKELGSAFEQAINWIFDCKGRVITCGIGKSGHIARKTAGTLSSTGTPSLFLHAAEAVHGDLGGVTDQDIVLLYTHSGETDEIVNLFAPFRACGARTILVTGRADSSAGRLADLILDTRVRSEACPNNLAPTTSTTVMLALSDALAVAVMQRRNFGREDFAKFHPSGALGKRLLLRVSDVMRPFEEIATAAPDEPILEVMGKITQAGVGAACVIEGDHTFLGYLSEGDLRRHFVSHASNPFEGTVSDLMKADAKTIGPTLLAVDALEVFQNFPVQIGDMPVVEDGKLMGLLVLKDLLRSGIL